MNQKNYLCYPFVAVAQGKGITINSAAILLIISVDNSRRALDKGQFKNNSELMFLSSQ